MTRVKLKKITIERAEGPIEGGRVPVDKPIVVTSWEAAEGVLLRIAADKRDEPDWEKWRGTYDKTDFKVEWEDGETYEGRADVTADGDDTDLAKHIREYCAHLAGLERPLHMTPERYRKAVETYKAEGYAKGAIALLTAYELPGADLYLEGAA